MLLKSCKMGSVAGDVFEKAGYHPAHTPPWPYASPNTLSVIHRLKPGLSMNCLNSSVSSSMTLVMTRTSARSCSIRAFSRSEFGLAFLKGVSFATREGIVSVIISLTRSGSSQGDVAEVFVERLENVREVVQLGLAAAPSATARHWLDRGVDLGECDLLHGPLLDPVAVHVYGVEDALRRILLDGGWQL